MLCNLCVSLGASIAGYPALTGNAIENQELGELIYNTMNPYKNQELWALHYVNLMLQFKKPGVRLVNFTIYVFPIKNQLYDFKHIEQNFGNKVVSFSFTQLAEDEIYQLNCKNWVPINWFLGSLLIISSYRNYNLGFQLKKTSRCASSFNTMKQELTKVYEWNIYFFGYYIFIYETSISIVKPFYRNSSWKETWCGTNFDS